MIENIYITSGIYNVKNLLNNKLDTTTLAEENQAIAEATKAIFKANQLLNIAENYYASHIVNELPETEKNYILAKIIFLIVKDCTTEHDHSFTTNNAQIYWNYFKEAKTKGSIILNGFKNLKEEETLDKTLENIILNCLGKINQDLPNRIQKSLNQQKINDIESIVNILLTSTPGYATLIEGLNFYESLAFQGKDLQNEIDQTLETVYLDRSNLLGLSKRLIASEFTHIKELETFINKMDFYTKLPSFWFITAYKEYMYALGPGGMNLIIVLSAAIAYLNQYRN